MPADPWVGTWRPHRPRMAIAAMYNSPGPKYMLRGQTGFWDHDVTTNRAPAYSMAKRHPGLKDSGTPAPRTLPEKMTHHGKESVPAWTMAHRHKDYDPGKTPGPANYKVHEADRLVHHNVPAYSIALRTVGFKLNEGPGPARYKDVPVSGPKIPHLKAAPAYSISQKTAFGSMLSNIVKVGSAFIPMPLREAQDRFPAEPALQISSLCCSSQIPPSDFKSSANKIPTSPRHRSKHRECTNLMRIVLRISKTPGPCAYKHVDTDVFKNRAPKYTIVERNTIPGDTTLKPGPARYRAENVNLHKNYPKYTFGIHHSEFLAPLIVAPSD
ncbi:ciliary microtubule associated protein 1B [Stegostoma tigrinum]|uniref:ciliary microtubule associated protein 1B n=1 Tax=Stegostoma tigrinum TaxID=3053191 RepID=UPI00286FB56A|nr:ciliary microtubule associated protein 1B [Stegostoma tigrinum]